MPKINCEGLHMYYELEGAGTPLVLIHGLSGDHLGWAMQTPALAAAGYQCLVFDNRDVGQTDTSPTGEYNIRQFADDTVALMSQLAIGSAHIVGASMGGMIGQEIAINYPERVLSLTLVCTAPAVDPFITHIIKSWMLLRPQCSLEDFFQIILPWVFTHRFFEQPGAVQDFMQLVRDNPFPQTVDCFRRQCEAVLTHDAQDHLAAIKSPTHVIVGEEDILTPVRYSRGLAQQIPKARLTVLPGSGHGLFWEKPTEFNQAVLDFLKEQVAVVA